MKKPASYTHQTLDKLEVYYPARAKEVVNILVEKNEKEKLIPKWRDTQLRNFLRLLDSFAFEIRRAHGEKKILTLAWLTRNFLELHIWIRYCNLSERNAKRFYDDTLRDFYGYSKAIEALFQKRGIDDRRWKGILKAFSQFAKTKGLDNVADDFTRVSQAATELCDEKEFLMQNKMLSKFAHPTALALEFPDSDYILNSIGQIFLIDGVYYATDSLMAIRDFVVIHYPESSPITQW